MNQLLKGSRSENTSNRQPYHHVQILGLGVAHRDGGVRPLEQLGHRRADDLAATDDDGVGAGDRNARTSDQLHAAVRRARQKTAEVPDGNATLVHGVQTVGKACTIKAVASRCKSTTTYPSTSLSGDTASVIRCESIGLSDSRGIWTMIP